jgi:hypothetical protein
VLPSSSAEKNAYPSHRGVPEELKTVGIKLRCDGATPVFVFRHLSTLYRDRHYEEPPFTYHDVYVAISPHSFDTAMDTTGFVQRLQERKEEEGLFFNWESDEESTMTRCFFVFKNAIRHFSDGYRPVSFDTKHGSNRYGLRLGCFTTVGRDGSTVLLAASLLRNEDKESFEWVFKQFQLCFAMAPHCIFTDGDKAMAAAVASTWSATKHLLCISGFAMDAPDLPTIQQVLKNGLLSCDTSMHIRQPFVCGPQLFVSELL